MAQVLNPGILQAPAAGKEAAPLPPQIMALVEKAIQAFQKAISAENRSVYHQNLGNALAMQGKADLALQAYLAAQQGDANRVEPTVSLAALMIQQYRYAEALPYLQRAIPALEAKKREREKDPSIQQELAAALYNFALALEGVGNREEAVKAYQRYTEAAPQDADGFCRLGQTYKALRLKKEALAAYQQCLRLAPADAEAQKAVKSLR
jgi:tetratricopeptide (TPR) repeat protein